MKRYTHLNIGDIVFYFLLKGSDFHMCKFYIVILSMKNLNLLRKYEIIRNIKQLFNSRWIKKKFMFTENVE